jgi:hypothetical protein
MRIDDPLGVARGAGGVTDNARRPFIERRPLIISPLRLQKTFVDWNESSIFSIK